eukprot:Nitzschia sp. Nitz4//scaffold127_size64804//2701//7868//NITZ4_006172-RA/size64804-processed-gene-0.12-mRNA-1//1//CDS//3329534738//4518//frame0
MGVPKFYRWLSERYPKCNEIVSDSALLPEFDHLYLDMNGIIHGCTHPSHLDVSDVLSERDMMLGIMHYLDRIVTQIVKPKVSIFMAIDGVAPRAKLNQQRSRRFRSAKEMKESMAGKEQKEYFDSNCITPGTEFMAKVSQLIHYFIAKKLNEDPAWRNLKVVFSGHEVPGEGEHKLMEHLRRMRAQPGYQPNTRHCIYGQDADLIMLALVTHEPHFTILREVVDFQAGFTNNNVLKQVKRFTRESGFQLLHLSVLREYLEMEHCDASSNMERIIDDFVFLTFLVGNDFLPHLISLDIGEGAFDLIFNTYREHRAAWGKDQYMTAEGEICDPARLEAFLAAIGASETETLEQREINDAEFRKKKRRWNKRDGIKNSMPSDEELADVEATKQEEYEAVIDQMMKKHPNGPFVDGWTPSTSDDTSKDFKGRYYYEKMKMTPVDIPAHLALRQSYIEGLMWCLAYYYRGCISWGWFYPYHYGPMLSDLTNLPEMFQKIKFELGKPILPFQQLMSCLPPASSNLVPPMYRRLMTSPESPILDFYPTDFEVDMNGKKNPWEGVNLLPFIEINRLLKAIQEHCPDGNLTPTEKVRNTMGDTYCYWYDETCNRTVPAPSKAVGLPEIANCHAAVSVMPPYPTESVPFKAELIPGTQIPFPGYPSLKVLPIESHELVPIRINVFGMPSKYPTVVLKLHQMPELPPIDKLADALISKTVFVNWPMMHEAKVVGISDATTEIRMTDKKKKKVRKYSKMESDRWIQQAMESAQGYFAGTGIPGSGGLQLGELKVRLKVIPLQGMSKNAKTGETKKVYGKQEADVPLQLALWKNPAPDPRFDERGPMSLADRFPSGSKVVLTKGKYRGCLGKVVGTADGDKVGVKVETMPPEIPFGLALARSVFETYVTSSDAARILKLHPGLLGKLTGSMMFEPGKYDLGLNLKSSDGMCVPGFTRRKVESNGNKDATQKKAWNTGDTVVVVGSNKRDQSPSQGERIIWEYTPRAINLIKEYKRQFPKLFKTIMQNPNEKKYDASQIFGKDAAEELATIRAWLNNVESAKLARSPVSTDSMSRDAVTAVEKAATLRNLVVKKKGYPKESVIKIPGNALYLENSTAATDLIQTTDFNQNEAPVIGDRVVNLCATGVPFGAKGTVVAVHDQSTGCVEVVMDEEFIGGTNLQGMCSNFRGKLCAWNHLLRIKAENSDSIADKLVPRGSGKADVDKILAHIEMDGKNTKTPAGNAVPQTITPSTAATTHVAAPKQAASQAKPKETPKPATASVTPNRGTSNQRAAVTTSAARQRAGSSGRDKQAGWREASGPPGKSSGFNWEKKSKRSGLNRWKDMMKTAATSSANNKSSNDLKALLGVSASAPPAAVAPVPLDPSVALKATLGVGSAPPKTAELKSMLGVPQPPPVQGASADLKAMLGVAGQAPPMASIPMPPVPMQHIQQAPVPVPPIPYYPSQPATAADKLSLLMSKASIQPPVPLVPQPGHSPFNFSYTDAGNAAAAAMPPPPQGPYPVMMPSGPHGVMPPMHVPMAHPSMMAPPARPAQPKPLQAKPQAPPPPPAKVFSDDDFPALG